MSEPRLFVRSYRALDRLYGSAAAAMDALHRGFWLGLLTRPGLDEATAAHYRGAARYLEDEHNRQGLLDWERRSIESYFAGCRTLLVGAAGGGRETLALCQRGFEVTAFDCLPELVTGCSEFLLTNGQKAEVVQCPASEVPAGGAEFDGAVIGWGGYMHIVGRKARIDFLTAMAARLRPDSPLLVSFLTRDADSRRFRWIRGVATIVRRLRLSGEPVELGDTVAGSFDHHFTREEIGSELEEAGYQVVDVATRPYGHAVARIRPRTGNRQETR